ncbi:hypothetical protein TB1_015801 [Malus domestica]
MRHSSCSSNLEIIDKESKELPSSASKPRGLAINFQSITATSSRVIAKSPARTRGERWRLGCKKGRGIFSERFSFVIYSSLQ